MRDTDKDIYLGLASLVSSYQDFFITAEYPDQLIDIENNLFKKHKEFFPGLYKVYLKTLKIEEGYNLKKGDNPVLFFYKFKEEYDET